MAGTRSLKTITMDFSSWGCSTVKKMEWAMEWADKRLHHFLRKKTICVLLELLPALRFVLFRACGSLLHGEAQFWMFSSWSLCRLLLSDVGTRIGCLRIVVRVLVVSCLFPDSGATPTPAHVSITAFRMAPVRATLIDYFDSVRACDSVRHFFCLLARALKSRF